MIGYKYVINWGTSFYFRPLVCGTQKGLYYEMRYLMFLLFLSLYFCISLLSQICAVQAFVFLDLHFFKLLFFQAFAFLGFCYFQLWPFQAFSNLRFFRSLFFYAFFFNSTLFQAYALIGLHFSTLLLFKLFIFSSFLSFQVFYMLRPVTFQVSTFLGLEFFEFLYF